MKLWGNCHLPSLAAWIEASALQKRKKYKYVVYLFLGKCHSFDNTAAFWFFTFPSDQTRLSVCQYSQPIQLLFIKRTRMTNGFACCGDLVIFRNSEQQLLLLKRNNCPKCQFRMQSNCTELHLVHCIMSHYVKKEIWITNRKAKSLLCFRQRNNAHSLNPAGWRKCGRGQNRFSSSSMRPASWEQRWILNEQQAGLCPCWGLFAHYNVQKPRSFSANEGRVLRPPGAAGVCVSDCQRKYQEFISLKTLLQTAKD